jgi:hypothetical protein
MVQIVKELAERVRQIGISAEQRVAVERSGRLDARQVLGNRRVQTPLAFRRMFLRFVIHRTGTEKTSTKRFLTFVALLLNNGVLWVWHCLESDVVANSQDHPRIQAVCVGLRRSAPARTLLDVVSRST